MIDTSLIERVNENLVLLEAYKDLPENYYGRLKNRKEVTSKEIKSFIYFILGENVLEESKILMDLMKIVLFLELEEEGID